jgi:hypothetical protein
LERKASFDGIGFVCKFVLQDRATCGEGYLVFGGWCSLNTETTYTKTNKQVFIRFGTGTLSFDSNKVLMSKVKSRRKSGRYHASEAKGGRFVIAIGAEPAGLWSTQGTLGRLNWHQISLGGNATPSFRESFVFRPLCSPGPSTKYRVEIVSPKPSPRGCIGAMDPIIEMLALPHSIAIHRCFGAIPAAQGPVKRRGGSDFSPRFGLWRKCLRG